MEKGGLNLSDVFGGHELSLPYRPIGELLAAYRDRDPEKAAIVDLDQQESINFGALDRAVADIALHLKSLGIGKGDRVLLLSEGCMEKLLLWLGTWRAGAIVCPFNVELNAQHLVFLARVIDAKLTLVHKDLDEATLLGEMAGPRIRFGSFNPRSPDPRDEFFTTMSRNGDATLLAERNEAADISSMFCTSGTTSRPKIVVYDHAGSWLCGLSTIDPLGLSEDDRILEYRSFSWASAQMFSLIPFLQKGLTLCVARRFSHSRFFEWIQRHGITFSPGVPTVVNMLLNSPLGYTAADIPTLRLMTCSTAPLTEAQWRRFEEMYGITLLQAYGMSEAGLICCNRHDSRKIGTVGPPTPHQEFQIVDPSGAPCPAGVEGEVTAGGPQVAIGYLQDDGQIDPIRGKRIKTGDLAVMDADGFVRLTGRTKDVIIRSGINISAQEIDEVLLAHPQVIEAAAVGVPDPIYGEEVVCYVSLKPGEMLIGDSILAYCRTRLPLPKVPKHVVVVSELPKNDRGKILRDRLRADWCRRMEAEQGAHHENSVQEN